MGENSKIEWTTHTFNCWRGCTKISAGCSSCYAEALSHRNPKVLGVWGDKGTRVIASDSAWREPLKWDRDAARAGERHRVFCASLADVFEDRSELVAPRVRLFHLINETPHLDWLLLTKRPQNIRRFYGSEGVPRSWAESVPSNVWLGTSVENQETANERIPHLLRVPAAVHFLSMEPLLGPVNLRDIHTHGHWERLTNALDGSTLVMTRDGGGGVEIGNKIAWIIVGGESGPGSRPCELSWIRSIVRQCNEAGTAAFVKQMGARPFQTLGGQPTPDGTESFPLRLKDKKGGDWDEWPEDLRIRNFPRPEVAHAL